MAEVAGQTVVDGRYKITSRIGSGGMADVYCADDTHLGREVALKILHRRFSQDEEFVERFRREASAAAGLQHPNVVAVFDRGSHDDTWYIAMERLKGRTLKQVVQDDGPLDQNRAIDITVQILQAAGFAHKRGVVHRDFKPHNVIVAGDDSVKVTDFGIARAGASEMTETGSIMGTAQYLSPEQAQGQRVDSRSDLYSIGVLLFELLTGQVPFTGESAVSIALKHVSEPPPSVASWRPDVHPVLDAVIARALVKDPSGRFQSAEEFVLALDDARRAIQSGVPGEHTAGFVPVGPPPPPGLVDEDEEDRDRGKWPFIALGLVILALLGIGAFVLLSQPDQVEVPRTAGLDVDRASQRLERNGFDVETREVRNPKEPGIVLGSDPAQGKKVDEGATITLVVSSGPGEVTVPDVEGFSEGRAQKVLAKRGFKFQTDERSSTSVEAGRVIKTRPDAGDTVEYGSRIVMIISTGPDSVDVPGVVGQTRSSAENELQGAGLNVSVREQESDKPENEVLSQTPSAGTEVEEGTTVSIVVSSGRPEASVPDVTGQDLDDARAALREAGFQVSVSERETDDPLEDGVVIGQRPSGGSERREGSTVTIIVGRAPEDDGSDLPPPPADEGTE